MKSGGQGQEASPQGVAPTPKGQAVPRSQVYSPDTEAELDSLLSPVKTPPACTSPNHTAMMSDTALDWSFPEALLDLTNTMSPVGPGEALQDVTLENLQELLNILRGPEGPSPLRGSLLKPSLSSISQPRRLPQGTPTGTEAAMSLESKLLGDCLLYPSGVFDPSSTPTPIFSPTPPKAYLSPVKALVLARSYVSVCNCNVLRGRGVPARTAAFV